MANSNPSWGNNPGLSDAISRLQLDAVYLLAMAQGIDALYDTIKADVSPTSNAMPAFLRSMVQWAEKLVHDIEVLEHEERGRGKMSGP